MPSSPPSFNNLMAEMDLGTEMTDDELASLTDLCNKYNDIFSTGDYDLGYCNKISHKIYLQDDFPVKVPHRRIPPHQWQEVRDHIQTLLKQGVIRESSSPFASPVVIVRKKDGSMRLCVDYRALNNKTRKDAYPLLRIEEALDALKGAKYFCSLDLAHGYYQVPVDSEDIPKTAFRVGTGGLYEYTRMPFGLCNAPATFMRIMDHIFGDQNFQSLLIYLDDILVFGSTLDETLERLEMVFSRLQKFNLKVKPSKCQLFKQQVKYLGHMVSKDGILPNPDKLTAVSDWPIPTTETELRGFLGLASYYRRFVPGFAKIASPLHSMTGNVAKSAGRSAQKKKGNSKRNISAEWTEKHTEAFNQLKDKLTSAPILGFPDFTAPYILETDASLKGLGAVLSQQQGDKLVVLGYASRGLKDHERNMSNYSSMKLELLALKWAITEKFRDLLIGAKFVVYTDNSPLSYIQTSTKLGATETRWVADLASFDFSTKYRSGKSNGNADALSRHPHKVCLETIDIDEVDVPHSGTAIPRELAIEMEKVTNDVWLEETYCRLEAHSASHMSSTTIPSISKEQLRKLQQEDPVLNRIWHYWAKGKVPELRQWKAEREDVRRLLRDWEKLREEDGVLYRVIDVNGVEIKQLCLPISLKGRVLELQHDQAGHQAQERTYQLIRRRCFWPGMVTDVVDYCKKCSRCMLAKGWTQSEFRVWSLVSAETLGYSCDRLHSFGEKFQRVRKRLGSHRYLHQVYSGSSDENPEGKYRSQNACKFLVCTVWSPQKDP